MVGPRSSGCRTCVRRRVRCDGTRPICAKCEKGGFQCTGIPSPTIFMPPLTVRSVRLGTETSSEVVATHEKSASSIRSTTLRHDLVIGEQGDMSFSMPGLTLTPSLFSRPSEYSDDAYFIFFLDRYFCFDNWNDDFQGSKAWFWKALQSPSQLPISSLASRALTTAFFAQVHKIECLQEKAIHLHGLALKKMVSRMQDTQVSFDVIFANALLGLYEACSYTSRFAWQKHSRAMRTLYQSMGPEPFRKRPARSLLMMCRFSIIARSIASQEKCFLAEDKWSNILTSDDAEASLTVKLGDLVVHAPGIFESIKDLSKLCHDEIRGKSVSLKGQGLFEKLLEHLQSLKQWWYEWTFDPRRMPERVSITAVSSDDNTMPGAPPHPSSVLHFCNLEAAAGWCRYHTHVILLLRWMQTLLSLRIPRTISSKTCTIYPELLPLRDNTSLRVSEEDIHSHAVAVCDGLHCFSLPRYRHVGAVYMGLFARIAWQSFPSGSPYSVWIEQLMIFMAAHSGFSMPGIILRDIELKN